MGETKVKGPSRPRPGQPTTCGRVNQRVRMNPNLGSQWWVWGNETRWLVVVLESRLKLLTEGNHLEQATLRDREIRSLNRFYCWIPAKFPEHLRRKEHLRRRIFQSPQPWPNLVEERQNRLGANGGGGDNLERIWSVLGLIGVGHSVFIRPAPGPGNPARTGRATRRTPEASRVYREPVPIDPPSQFQHNEQIKIYRDRKCF
jgi:hypothetical protein